MVSTAEKAHMMRQVRAGKANASEPLLKCRKRVDGIGTGAGILPRDESGGCLRSWPGGVRHEGGASPGQAPVRNVVRAENRIHGSDQQSCSPDAPSVMIVGHVPAVRLSSHHAGGHGAAAVPA